MFQKLHIENSLLEHDNYCHNWHLNAKHDQADKPIIKRIKNERKKKQTKKVSAHRF